MKRGRQRPDADRVETDLRSGERLKTCSCGMTLLCSADTKRTDFHARGRDEDGTPRDYQVLCRYCKTEQHAQRLAEDPEYAARVNERQRAGHARRMKSKAYARKLSRQALKRKREWLKDPANAEKARRNARKYAAKKRSTPEGRAAWSESVRERRARLKAEDPVRYQAMLAKERERTQRLMEDPEKRQRDSENRRIARRLRQEIREGTLQMPVRLSADTRESFERVEVVPSGPFLEWLRPQIERHGKSDVARRIGVDPSRLTVVMAQPMVTLGFADRAYVAFSEPHLLALHYPR